MEEKRTLWTPTQLDFKHNRERRWFFLKIPRCDTNGGCSADLRPPLVRQARYVARTSCLGERGFVLNA